ARVLDDAGLRAEAGDDRHLPRERGAEGVDRLDAQAMADVARVRDGGEHALSHLRRRLDGEGDGDDLFGLLDRGEQADVALHQELRLARAGRRLDDEGAARVERFFARAGVGEGNVGFLQSWSVWKPMRRFGGSASGWSKGRSLRYRSCSASSCCRSVLSISARRLRMAVLAATCSRRRTNARTTKTLICTARSVRSTFATISTPCSVTPKADKSGLYGNLNWSQIATSSAIKNQGLVAPWLLRSQFATSNFGIPRL